MSEGAAGWQTREWCEFVCLRRASQLLQHAFWLLNDAVTAYDQCPTLPHRSKENR